MKISKLFHWLYAFVMFLPILALGSSILISTFNMSAKQQSELHYKYNTNLVNSSSEYIIGNAYHIKVENDYWYNVIQNGLDRYELAFYNIQQYDFTSFGIMSNEVTNVVNSESTNLFLVLSVTSALDDYDAYFTVHNNLNENGLYDLYVGNLDASRFTLEGDFILKYAPNTSFKPLYVNNDLNYNPIESVVTHNIDSKEIFYATLDELKTSPYFSWAYNSFLSAPLVYIVGLFSMPTNHVVVMLLSYWLAISIIWLVFDLIMYVPLLVHRWLDKGVLE